MMARAALAQSAWLVSNLGGWRRYRAALADPAAAQQQVLDRILQRAAGTEYGRAHGLPGRFSSLPPRTYDELAPWITRCANGEPDVLVPGPVSRFEPSSGSAAASKLLPITAELRAEFQRAIAPWIVDLYSSRPALLAGPAYWSISPVVQRQRTPGGAAVGFEEDSAYLGRVGQRLVDASLAVPGSVRNAASIDEFRRQTLLFLLAAAQLSVLSVWNPSFLTLLLAPLTTQREALIRDLHDGVTIAGVRLRDPRRAAALERAGSPGEIWPQLRLISCWCDAHAASALPAVQEAFPGVEIQPKGLLATEAFISLPFAGAHPLAILSHYLEFETDDGRLLGVHELTEGQEAAVVVSTSGGLLRYRLQDRIQVTGFVARTPSIRFLGRQDRVSDLRGEKLSEAFVGSTLRRLGLSGFSMLAPDAERPGYTLFTEQPGPTLAARLQEALCENIHYRWCVELGQLEAVRVFAVAGDGWQAYLSACQARGQRLGDIKPTALDTRRDWDRVLAGEYR